MNRKKFKKLFSQFEFSDCRQSSPLLLFSSLQRTVAFQVESLCLSPGKKEKRKTEVHFFSHGKDGFWERKAVVSDDFLALFLELNWWRRRRGFFFEFQTILSCESFDVSPVSLVSFGSSCYTLLKDTSFANSSWDYLKIFVLKMKWRECKGWKYIPDLQWRYSVSRVQFSGAWVFSPCFTCKGS